MSCEEPLLQLYPLWIECNPDMAFNRRRSLRINCSLVTVCVQATCFFSVWQATAFSFYFQAAWKKEADHQTTGWSRVPTYGDFLCETSKSMPWYSWGKWAKTNEPMQIDPDIQDRTLSICHFLNLKLSSLLSGSVEAIALWWPPTPFHQTFFCPDGIHCMRHLCCRKPHEHGMHPVSPKQRFEAQHWFMSSLMSLLCSFYHKASTVSYDKPQQTCTWFHCEYQLPALARRDPLRGNRSQARARVNVLATHRDSVVAQECSSRLQHLRTSNNRRCSHNLFSQLQDASNPGVTGLFFLLALLGLIPGGTPFSQLNKGVRDAMSATTKRDVEHNPGWQASGWKRLFLWKHPRAGETFGLDDARTLWKKNYLLQTGNGLQPGAGNSLCLETPGAGSLEHLVLEALQRALTDHHKLKTLNPHKRLQDKSRLRHYRQGISYHWSVEIVSASPTGQSSSICGLFTRLAAGAPCLCIVPHRPKEPAVISLVLAVCLSPDSLSQRLALYDLHPLTHS